MYIQINIFMTSRKFEVFKIVITFLFAGIIGPLVSMSFAQFDANHKETAALRERALSNHDKLIEAGAQRAFWARRLLHNIDTYQSKANLSIEEYNRATAIWNANISSGLRNIENTYPPEIWEQFRSINSELGKVDHIVQRQIADVRKHGAAGGQEDNIARVIQLSNDVIELSYTMQIYIVSDEFISR